MKDINHNINDKNALWDFKFLSYATWFLFFILIPIPINFSLKIFGVNLQGNSTISVITYILLFYGFNAVIATLIVKWQNRMLEKKTLKFRKTYFIFISIFLWMSLLIEAVELFIIKK